MQKKINILQYLAFIGIILIQIFDQQDQYLWLQIALSLAIILSVILIFIYKKDDIL